jgi:ubiquinone/menaquinone biosynthesis C-methylase UbiE
MNISEKRVNSAVSFFFLFGSLGLFGQNDIQESWEKSLNERQPPDKVMTTIGVKPGMTIGEIGCGRGRYTVYLARETGPSGKVFANDIDEASLSYLRGRCRRLNINNVETITGEEKNPLFPEKSLDMAIMVLVYHMIENPDPLLINLKKSLKTGARLIILDPHDSEIDREFGIDRSGAGSSVPTIKERIEESANKSGYRLLRTETFLPLDYIFILEPQSSAEWKSAGDILLMTLMEKGIDSSVSIFNKIKGDSLHFDFPENIFTNLGYEFIGSRSYPKALAVLNMGVELYPKSSRLYGEIGEVYLLTGEKEKARRYYKLFLENGPDSLNTKNIMQNFDALWEQMHPEK